VVKLFVFVVLGLLRWFYEWTQRPPGDEPYRMEFDAVNWKVRHEWGVAANDPRMGWLATADWGPAREPVAVASEADFTSVFHRPVLLRSGDSVTVTCRMTLS
jgi:hypothetical protein